MPGASTRGGLDGSDSEAHSEVARRKANSDLLFLAGLLVGGPLMTFGGRFRLGLFLVLAGAISSVLRRYSGTSLAGSVAIGAAVAALIAAVLGHAP